MTAASARRRGGPEEVRSLGRRCRVRPGKPRRRGHVAQLAGSRNRPLRTLLVPAPLVIVITMFPLTA